MHVPRRLERRILAVFLTAVVPIEQGARDEEADQRACVYIASFMVGLNRTWGHLHCMSPSEMLLNSNEKTSSFMTGQVEQDTTKVTNALMPADIAGRLR